MQPEHIVQQVSLDLTDQEPGYEYARWPFRQLTHFLQEAVNHAVRVLPDLFIKTVVVKLEPGDVWQESCSCTRIVRALGETDESGRRIIRGLRRTTDSGTLLWQGTGTAHCPRVSGPYRMESYSVNSTDARSFRVYPPVPATETKPHYVALECVTQPSMEGGDDVPWDIVAACKQWMLWRALAQDSENNPTAAEVAGRHRETFFKLIDDLHAATVREEAENVGGNDTIQSAQNRSS